MLNAIFRRASYLVAGCLRLVIGASGSALVRGACQSWVADVFAIQRDTPALGCADRCCVV
jgi:hypothetical protein